MDNPERIAALLAKSAVAPETARDWVGYVDRLQAQRLLDMGFTIVPREPTQRMIEDGGETPVQEGGGYDDALVIWRAMIAAAERDDA